MTRDGDVLDQIWLIGPSVTQCEPGPGEIPIVMHEFIADPYRSCKQGDGQGCQPAVEQIADDDQRNDHQQTRSEEHTSELQSRGHLVCRLLLEKKNKNDEMHTKHHTTNNHVVVSDNDTE